MARKRPKLLLAALVLVPIAAGAVYLGLRFVDDGVRSQSLTIDSCLDAGGCWDSVDQVCRMDEPNAQDLCERRAPSASE
jgi:hypothetical protein